MEGGAEGATRRARGEEDRAAGQRPAQSRRLHGDGYLTAEAGRAAGSLCWPLPMLLLAASWTTVHTIQSTQCGHLGRPQRGSQGNQGRELLPQPIWFISTLGSGLANPSAGLPAQPAPSTRLSDSCPPAR
ncbi:hypothetical protein CapIbe_001599 [Capra ibex]